MNYNMERDSAKAELLKKAYERDAEKFVTTFLYPTLGFGEDFSSGRIKTIFLPTNSSTESAISNMNLFEGGAGAKYYSYEWSMDKPSIQMANGSTLDLSKTNVERMGVISHFKLGQTHVYIMRSMMPSNGPMPSFATF